MAIVWPFYRVEMMMQLSSWNGYVSINNTYLDLILFDVLEWYKKYNKSHEMWLISRSPYDFAFIQLRVYEPKAIIDAFLHILPVLS